MSFAIITDSTSDISPARAQELGIYVIPLHVIIEGEDLLDQVQIIKQSAASAQETVKKHQELTEKQESYIKQMEASLENNKSQIESLEHRLASVNASHSDDDESDQLAELETAKAAMQELTL